MGLSQGLSCVGGYEEVVREIGIYLRTPDVRKLAWECDADI